jgi:hypothetical protein
VDLSPTRSVLVSAFLLTCREDDLDDDEFFRLFDRVGADTLETKGADQLYHLPLSHLLLEQAIRFGARQQKIEARLGLNDFADRLETAALAVLSQLMTRRRHRLGKNTQCLSYCCWPA